MQNAVVQDVVVMMRLLSVPIRGDWRSVLCQQRQWYLETLEQTDALHIQDILHSYGYISNFIVFVELCVEPC